MTPRIIDQELEGAELGVSATVAVLHAVRLITVLLVLPIFVKLLSLSGLVNN